MKKHSIQALAALALLASCSSDDFIGGNGTPTQPTTSNAISFEGGTGKITRANKTGDQAATALSGQFVVYGNKKLSEIQTQKVYDLYNVDWVNNTTQSETNVYGWEYVGKGSDETNKPQTIKYWDYSATEYNFVAWSVKGANTVSSGEGQTTTYQENVKVTSITDGQSTAKEYTEGYILTGKASDLAKCYIADRVTAKKNVASTGTTAGSGQEAAIANRLIKYQNAVQFNFRKLETKVRIGLYETIPGYSVKDVKFYTDESTKSTDNKPALYAASATIPDNEKEGTVTVTFGTDKTKGDYNKAQTTWKAKDNNADKSNITLKTLKLTTKEKNESTDNPDNVYLGRTANDASLPEISGEDKGYTSVIPANVGVLTLKVDYTLVSTDGSGETINVKGATAQVPAQYTNWQPNYAYTYLFKITDKTNGSTGTDPGDPKGLYPIVFDAVVTETEEGIQNTITTVSTPSITTYQKGKLNSDDAEYKTGENIYVSVVGAGTDGKAETLNLYSSTTTGEDENASTTYKYYGKLYKVNFTDPANSITEAEAEKAVANNNKVGDKELKVVPNDNSGYSTSGLDTRFANAIEANDAVDGVKVTGNFFKFKPTEAATYVFEYNKDNTKAYKVIKVAATQP